LIDDSAGSPNSSHADGLGDPLAAVPATGRRGPGVLERRGEILAAAQARVRRRGAIRRVRLAAPPAAGGLAALILTAWFFGVFTPAPPKLAQPGGGGGADAGSGVAHHPEAASPVDGVKRDVAVVENPLNVPAPTVVQAKTDRREERKPGFSTIRIVEGTTLPLAPSTVETISGSSTRYQFVRTIDDDELITALAATGRDCGLVNIGRNRTMVVCNSCGPEDRLFGLDRWAPPHSGL